MPNPPTSSATASGPGDAVRRPAGRPALKPLEEAVADLLLFATPLAGTESVSTFDADGRVLAQGLHSSLDVPGHDNSAMDGYAVRSADWQGRAQSLHVGQRIPAGSSGSPLAPASAARIFTGAPIPPCADAVVMQEDCELTGDAIRLRAAPQPGQWIRRRGEDVARGAQVLSSGTRLGPAALGLAASIGFDRLQVMPRLRVALFSTGDELVMPGDVPPAAMPPGAIYNSNRFFLRALLLRLGCLVNDMGIVPDRLDATTAALQAASQQHDVILTSGGVSVGEEDHIKPAVQSLGALHLWQIAIKPGKPFAYGKIGNAHFMGLPGNPVSSFVTFLLLVRPFILRLQGAVDAVPEALLLVASFDWPRADRRREFLRVRRNAAGQLDLFGNQSSGVLTSVVWADGLVDNPPGQVIRRGDLVRFIPFTALLS